MSSLPVICVVNGLTESGLPKAGRRKPGDRMVRRACSGQWYVLVAEVAQPGGPAVPLGTG